MHEEFQTAHENFLNFFINYCYLGNNLVDLLSKSNLFPMKTILSSILSLQVALFSTYVNAQYALEFNGDSDYVALNGQDFEPPWTMECLVNKTETDNYQHLLTGIDGNSGIRIEQALLNLRSIIR